MSSMKVITGPILRHARENQKMSKVTLHDKSGISLKSIENYEKKMFSNVTSYTYDCIFRALFPDQSEIDYNKLSGKECFPKTRRANFLRKTDPGYQEIKDKYPEFKTAFNGAIFGSWSLHRFLIQIGYGSSISWGMIIAFEYGWMVPTKTLYDHMMAILTADYVVSFPSLEQEYSAIGCEDIPVLRVKDYF